MSIRIGVLPYGPSDSGIALRDALQAHYAGNRDIQPRLIRTTNSVFRGRVNDIIINYGNRSAPASVYGTALVLNPQAVLQNAANKLAALRLLENAGVSIPQYTNAQAVAQIWLNEGHTVYQRNSLNGHSGEGIEILSAGDTATSAPLYTKALTGQRREWRVHVFKGAITHVQVKRRANGYRDNPNYSETVRNHHTGWIYATENINPNDEVLRNAVLAVEALGLDFGAVDLISRQESAWVLEVNTAAGLQAETTMSAFVGAITEFVAARIANRPAVYRSVFAVPAPRVLEPSWEEQQDEDPELEEDTAAPRPMREVRADSSPVAVTQVNEVQLSPTSPEGLEAENSLREDGWYLIRYQRLGTDGSSASSVVETMVWSSNNQFFRPGWNHPLSRTEVVSVLGKVSSVSAISPNTSLPVVVAF